MRNLKFNIRGIPAQDVERATLGLLDFLVGYTEVKTLHTPVFFPSYLGNRFFLALSTVTIDSIHLSDAYILLITCNLLDNVNFLSVFLDATRPPITAPIKELRKLRSFAMCAENCHFMDLLMHFSFPALTNLVISKRNSGGTADYVVNAWRDFLILNGKNLKTLCIGDYNGDLSPLLTLVAVLAAHDGNNPLYLHSLKTFAILEFPMLPQKLENFLALISTVAPRTARLPRLFLSVKCPTLPICHSQHMLTNPKGGSIAPCEACAELQLDYSPTQTRREEGTEFVLRVNDKVIF